MKADALIIGAGVVGLAIGKAILEARPSSKVIVLDKEPTVGNHASGRNSGVLHAGFYYSPESLKAKFCKEGNAALRQLCLRNSIPILETGKVVVARNENENHQLDVLLTRGISNGVDLELLEDSELPKKEPLARTHKRFLWSPKTAVSSPKEVIAAMQREFESAGGQLFLQKKVKLIESSNHVHVNGYEAKVIINAAGAQADKIAREVGLAREYAMVPFMGIYRAIPGKKLPLKRLVYPVPHPINPFLGVHFTLSNDGFVKIGPTAIPVLGREQYSLLSGWSISDINQLIRGSHAMFRGNSHDFPEIIRTELPKLFTQTLVKESATLVACARDLRGWKKRPPGIRSQLVNTSSGRLEQDFIVETKANSIHVLNAVSPGWTSSIPFGYWIANHYVSKLI